MEVEAVEAILEQERKAGHAKDARHKLTVERLRQKLVELQVPSGELGCMGSSHEQMDRFAVNDLVMSIWIIGDA